ncbi:MAG: hypothetical protein ACOCXF_03075 [bacterium]
MEKNRVQTHEQANGLSSNAGSAGQGQGRPAPVTYAKSPQFAGTMGTARPAAPSAKTTQLRSYYTGSLC